MERKEEGAVEGSEPGWGGLRRVSSLRAECEGAQSLWGCCNRIYYDIAMIQLSSCGFKPMLLRVQRTVQAHFLRDEDV